MQLHELIDKAVEEHGMHEVVQRLFKMVERTAYATMDEHPSSNQAALRFTLACGMLTDGFAAIEPFAIIFDQHTRNADGTVAFPIQNI